MLNYFKKQSGSIMPVTALAMASIIGMAGLVFDSGNVFVNKTKLQNLLDSAALGSAKVLSDSRSQFLASQAAREIISNTLAQPGYSQLADIGLAANSFVIQYSSTRNPFVANPAATRYVRIRLNEGVVQIDSLFMTGAGISNYEFTGSAVAGPSPALSTVCNVLPAIICGDPAVLPDAGGLFGYHYGAQVTLAMGNIQNNDIGPGNYQLLDLAEHGNDASLRASLAGDSTACVTQNSTVETKPGVNRGPVSQGFNTRFGIYNGPVSATY
ncbi:MAG: Tad domain-containing protein [Robiginitomaculum sp.]|nr:Tad domain-containing protein [Robiginitomaculum sp.]